MSNTKQLARRARQDAQLAGFVSASLILLGAHTDGWWRVFGFAVAAFEGVEFFISIAAWYIFTRTEKS